MEDRLEIIEDILEECKYYVNFVKTFGNECAATDRSVERIKELAANIKEFDISEME